MFFFRLTCLSPTWLLLVLTVLLLINEYTFAGGSRRTKNIPYLPENTSGFDPERHILDVYQPRNSSTTRRPVVVFIHGGSWGSGSKNLYAFIGRRLAKQNIVAVLINYRLSPQVLVPDMAGDCAQALSWTAKHIAEYGGDPNHIFAMGHSAGGGLAALLATNDALFTKIDLLRNPVKGAILDDPAGLDMLDYLTKLRYPGDEEYLIPFGKDPAVWRSMSALYFLSKSSPPMLLYAGERTYPGIAKSVRGFDQRLQSLGINHKFQLLPGKKHVGMVTQLFWKHNLIYRDLLKFVDADVPN